MLRRIFILLFALGGPWALPAAAQDWRLLMIESANCMYCRVFNRDIAPIYAASPEGRAAPLIHADLRGPWPDGVTLTSRPALTPTFILIGPDGTERGRIFGFPGEDFFWGYLERMFHQAGLVLDATPDPLPDSTGDG